MGYIIATAAVIILVIVTVALWRRREREARKALRRVDAYIDHGRIQSRLVDACHPTR